MNVEQEDLDLMAELFDYAALAIEQERTSPVLSSATRHSFQPPNMASNILPETITSASNDSAAVESRQNRSYPLTVPEPIDWPNEDFDIFPDVTNDWSFWAGHGPLTFQRG